MNVRLPAQEDLTAMLRRVVVRTEELVRELALRTREAEGPLDHLQAEAVQGVGAGDRAALPARRGSEVPR